MAFIYEFCQRSRWRKRFSESGLAQAVREIPGFLTFVVIYVLLIMKEHRLSAWSVVLLGIGIGATGFLQLPGLTDDNGYHVDRFSLF